MINFLSYKLNENGEKAVKYLYDMADKELDAILIFDKVKRYVVDFANKNVSLFFDYDKIATFNNVDDFLSNFSINGKPIIEAINNCQFIDYSKFNLDYEELHFIKSIHYLELGQDATTFSYKEEYIFDFEIIEGKVCIYKDDKELGKFDNADDFILNFKIGERTFIELIKDIDYR